MEMVKPDAAPSHSAMRPIMLEPGMNSRCQVAAVTASLTSLL